MMLPDTLEVHVSDSTGRPSLADLLVGLDFQIASRYYFGTVLGLTDQHGRVRSQRTAIEHDFIQNQQLFPSDYRVPLTDCDNRIVVRLFGEQEFTEAQAAAETNRFLNDEVRTLWRAARHRGLSSSRVNVDLPKQPLAILNVYVPLLLSGGSAPAA